MNKIAERWQDYQCLYAGDGQKIERWKDIILQRPEPLALWPLPPHQLKIDATYHRSSKGGGSWEFHRPLASFWYIDYDNWRFKVAPLGFKHTGVFPEQAANWDALQALLPLDSTRDFKVLNLFAYTGGATLACAGKATEVVHVDASKGMLNWAKENVMLSQLADRNVRFILDDCLKFILREQRRGRRYQAVIMDPPTYGRGPNNEIWKFDQQISYLVQQAAQLLADDAAFFLLNTYSSGFSSIVLQNILSTNRLINGHFSKIETGELLLPISEQNIYLPGGCYGLANRP